MKVSYGASFSATGFFTRTSFHHICVRCEKPVSLNRTKKAITCLSGCGKLTSQGILTRVMGIVIPRNGGKYRIFVLLES